MDRAWVAPLRPHCVRFDDDEQGLLQFARHLLEGDVALPLGHVTQRLHRDTVERLGALLARGVLHAIVRRGGWRRVRFVRGERVAEGRVWDTAELGGAEPRIGEAALSLVIELYDLLSRPPEVRLEATQLDRVRLCLQDLVDASPWEQLLVHVLCEPLVRVGAPAPLLQLLCGHSGLNAWTFGALPGLDVALDPDALLDTVERWGWLLPWTRGYVGAWWARAEGFKLATGAGPLLTTGRRLAAVTSVTAEAAQRTGRGELALPLLDFYGALGRSSQAPEDAVEHLESLLEALPVGERQVYRDAWASYLRPLRALTGWMERLRRTHPVDRGAGELLALSAWDAAGGPGTAARVEALRGQLERVVG